MRPLSSAFLAVAVVFAVAIPAGADDEWEPNLRQERVYFHCAGDDRQVDNTMAPTWSTSFPSQSFVDDQAGCGMVDLPVLNGTEQGTVFDASWQGTFEGNLDTLTVEVHTFNVGPTRVLYPVGMGAAKQVHVRLAVDGVPVLGDGVFVPTVPEVANEGVTYVVRFSVTDIGLVEEHQDREHDLHLTLHTNFDHFGTWVYDATEVPSGIMFNPPTVHDSSVPAG